MRRHAQEEASDVNVTPLLDIVFIMLIFFIVTAVFIDERGFKPNIPQPSPDKPDKPPAQPLVITVLSDGFVRIDGGAKIDARSSKPRVEEFFATNPEAAVVISAVETAPTRETILAYDLAVSTGAKVVLTKAAAQ